MHVRRFALDTQNKTYRAIFNFQLKAENRPANREAVLNANSQNPTAVSKQQTLFSIPFPFPIESDRQKKKCGTIGFLMVHMTAD